VLVVQPEEHHRLLLLVDLELKELFLLFILLHQQVVVLLVLEEVQDLKMVDLVVVEAVMEYKEHRLLGAQEIHQRYLLLKEIQEDQEQVTMVEVQEITGDLLMVVVAVVELAQLVEQHLPDLCQDHQLMVEMECL
tara:strand:- start:303 stop:707 length:405 start_codon:yes stop_codon:yes gene_type:complete